MYLGAVAVFPGILEPDPVRPDLVLGLLTITGNVEHVHCPFGLKRPCLELPKPGTLLEHREGKPKTAHKNAGDKGQRRRQTWYAQRQVVWMQRNFRCCEDGPGHGPAHFSKPCHEDP